MRIKPFSVRDQHHLLLYVAFPLGALALMVLMASAWHYLGLLVLPWAIFIAIKLSHIDCPQCGKRIDAKKRFIAPRYCPTCGHHLETKSDSLHRE